MEFSWLYQVVLTAAYVLGCERVAPSCALFGRISRRIHTDSQVVAVFTLSKNLSSPLTSIPS